MIIGTAALGYGFRASGSYNFLPRLGVYASVIFTMNPTSEDYHGKLPWVCDRCGLGYIPPHITSSHMAIGTWGSSMVVAGLEVMLHQSEPQLLVSAGYGLQRIASPDVLMVETGTQIVYSGSPPFITLGMDRSFAQGAATATAGITDLGLELRHRFSRRLHVSFTTDLLLGQSTFTGEQVYRYSGATQSDPETYFESRKTYSQKTGTSRILVQIGLSLALLGREPSAIKP